MVFTQPFALRKTIAETVSVDLDDTLRTKRGLGRLGYYEPPKSHGRSVGLTEIPDENLFAGLRRFQEDQGLKRDGVMKPGGPTAHRLGRAIAGVFAAARKKPAAAPSTSDVDLFRERIAALGFGPKRRSLLEDTADTPPPAPRKPNPPVTDPGPPPRKPEPPLNDPGVPPRKPEPPKSDQPGTPDEPDRDQPDKDEDERKKRCRELSRAIESAVAEKSEQIALRAELRQELDETKLAIEELQHLVAQARALSAAGSFIDVVTLLKKTAKSASAQKILSRLLGSRVAGGKARPNNIPDDRPISSDPAIYLERERVRMEKRRAGITDLRRSTRERIEFLEAQIRRMEERKSQLGCDSP